MDWDFKPSSRMSILLLRQIARARAKICLWPREKLPPPDDTGVSSVMRLSSSSDCTLSIPEALKASLSVASSYSPNGSKFSRIVPLRSSGCCGTGRRGHIRLPSLRAGWNEKRTYSHISSERVEVDDLRYDTVVHNRTLSRDQSQQR